MTVYYTNERKKGTIGMYINMGEWTLFSERRQCKEYLHIKTGLGILRDMDMADHPTRKSEEETVMKSG